jgi:transcriptional regulator with XRE-family HTH domain
VDAYVGERLRLRRVLRKISLDELAAFLNLTSQQVQKYEKGENRISAGRLFKLSQFLGVQPQFFFDDLPEPGGYEKSSVRYGFSEGDFTDASFGAVSNHEALQLQLAFNRVADPKVRRQILVFVRAIAGQPNEFDGNEPMDAN